MNFGEAVYSLCISSGLFRFLGALIIFPFPDSAFGVVPRLLLAALLALPNLDLSPTRAFPTGAFAFELMVGFATAVPLLCLVQGMRMAGDVIETARGHQMGLVIDPLSATEEQPLSILLSQTVLFLLVTRLGLVSLIFGSVGSMTQLPPASVQIEGLVTLCRDLLGIMNSTMLMLLMMTVPLAVMMLMSELAIGLLGKLLNGISLSSEAYLIRLLLAGAILYLGSDFFFEASSRVLLPDNP